MDSMALAQKETVLLLGAGADQLFAICTAKSMGLHVLTVDINPDAPGFALADDHAVISTKDVAALKKYIDDYRDKGHYISGVFVMGSDIPHVVAALAEHIGTPSISMESALLTTHKYEMKCRFRDRGIPVPWFKLVNSPDELCEIVNERGYPLIIKPVDRSGARGVFRLTEKDDPHSLFDKSLSESFCGQVMVEEYLDGPQISTETIMYKGRAYTPGFVDRNYEMREVYAPHIIENGGWAPSTVTLEERTAVEDLVEKAALALDVTDGVVKGDVVRTNKGPFIIEMAARLSGGDLCESLVPLSTGVNYVETAARIAMNKDPELENLKPKFCQAVVNRYFFPEPGRLVRVEGVEDVLNKEWIKKLEFWYEAGDLVPSPVNHAKRFGVFVAVGASRQEVDERAEWVYRTINIVTEKE